MNFGTSRNGRIAQSEGRAPASTVAKWIGHGLTANWIRRHVVGSGEWHHSQANLGGDGRPTDYFDRADAAAAWLAANFAARNASHTARKRCKALVAIAREFGVDSLPGARPLPVKKEKPAETIIGGADLTKRVYSRSRGRYRPEEVTIRVRNAAWRGEWLVWATGRCQRGSVVRLTPVSAEQELADAIQLWAAEIDRHLAAEGAIARRQAEQNRQLESLIAAYRRQPTEGRAGELSRRWKFKAEQIAAILEK